MKITVDTFERRKGIEDVIQRIEQLEASYDGGDEYIERHMVKHPKESQKNFNKRKKEAVYVNYCRQVIDLYNQYVFSEPATRELEGIDTEQYMGDADYMYSSHEDVIRTISKVASVKGMCGLIVDRPKAETRTKADEVAQGVHEYIAIYEPEAMLDWKVERINGRPTLTYLVLSEGEDLIKVWTQQEWKLAALDNKEVKIVDEGANALGVIPFVLHRNRRTLDGDWFSGASDIDDIAEVNRMLFYYDCMAMEIVSNTGFAMLTGSAEALTSHAARDGGDGGVENSEVNVGSASFLPREQGDPEYKYVEPPHSSLNAIIKLRNVAADEIRRLARVNINGAQGVKSGDALEIEFQDLNAILSEKAAMLEATETRIFELIAKWQDAQSYSINISYPRKFGVREIGRDIDNAIKALTVVQSGKFKKALSKRIAKAMTKDSKQEDVDAIVADIESGQATADILNGN